MIDAYITPGVMGAVSNGNYWIFKIRERFLNVGPVLNIDGRIDQDVYNLVVSLLTVSDELTAISTVEGWTDIWQPTNVFSAPRLWRASGGKGERAYHKKMRFNSLAEAAAAAKEKAADGAMAALLLEELLQIPEAQPVGYWEVSEGRMVWWLKEGERVARLDLTGKQLELLIHNKLLDAVGRENIHASIKMHDKNTAMSVLKASIPEEALGLTALFMIGSAASS